MTIYGDYSEIADALTLVAGRNPVQPRLYLHSPTVVFAARVNLPDPADYPISFVAYTDVTVGDYLSIRPGMTLLLGSTAGGDQYGRQRVNDDATTISIFVGRSSRGTHDGELTLVDNAYVTVLDLRMVWAKIPFIDSSGEAFKDGDLAVEWRTTTPPPVANMGQGDARTIDPDTGVTTVLFNGQPSYAVADGATITDYLWDIADGTLSAGTLTDDNITVTFLPGFRYVSLTVTDSNDKTATTWRPVYARDPDDDTSFDGFAIESHRYTDAGQTMTIRILEDMPRATYPDGTLAMIWDAEPVGASNRDHLLIVGWLDTEDVQANAGRTGLLRDTTITIQDVAQRLDTLPGFPQSVADDETRDTDKIPEITWNYMVDPTMDKYAHYLLAWHSTALEVADFYWSDTGADYAVAIKSSDGESLWQQVARLAGDMLPGYVLTCEPAGRIRVVPDPLLQDSADRTAVVQADISEDEWSDIRFSYRRAPTVHWLWTGALLVQDTITFNPPVGDNPPTVHLPTVFCKAPGDTPGQGLGMTESYDGLVSSQEVLNATTGHKYARLNNPVGLITVTLVQNDSSAVTNAPWSEINLALKEWVTLTMSATTAAQRGLTFTTARCLPKELNIRYNQGKAGLTRTLELTLEVETEGVPGATWIKPDVPAVGEQPPPPPPAPEWVPPVDGDEDYFYDDMKAYVFWNRAHVFRTWDIQDVSPTWEFIDSGITGNIQLGQYVHVNETTVGMWLMTSTAIWWCADIMATTPSWASVLTIASVRAAEVTPTTGLSIFTSMYNYASAPGHLCVATSPNTTSSENSTYQHAYFWTTLDYGVSWTKFDMSAYTRTVSGATHCYMHASLFGMNIFRSSPVIYCIRGTPYVGLSAVTIKVFYSTDLGLSWSEGATLSGSSSFVSYSKNSLLNPFPSATDPSYAVSGGDIALARAVLQVSSDGWATKSNVSVYSTNPSGYAGISHLWRPNKHIFDNDHIIGWFREIASGNYHLLESSDAGASWSLLYDSGEGVTQVTACPYGSETGCALFNTPNGWPSNPQEWVIIRSDKLGSPTAGAIYHTLDNFATLQSKVGNLATLLGGSSNFVGGPVDGYALPRTGVNA